MEPRDLFSSPDLAAKDFGLNYNDDSIRKNIEIGTFIRKINSLYTYDIPHEGDETSVDFIYKKNDISIIAKAHTHGAYKNSTTKSENDLNETRALEPSKKDIDSVKESGISLYTFTPDGSMYLNCNENGKVENYQYPSIFPSDINCPERKNDVNANNLPNNQTISKQEYINQR